MVTLNLCQIWQIISFILPANEYDCVYVWTMLGSEPVIDLQKMSILVKKNHIFSWSSFWSWRVCKQAKLSNLGHRKPARIRRRTQNESLFLCGFWSRCIIGPFFFENEQAEAVTVNGDRYRGMLNEFLFTNIEEEHLVSTDGATCNTAEATFDVLRSVFEDCITSRSADVVWPPRSCDLTPLDYYLWSAVNDKCYADKPKTIDALKNNIRGTIGEIQLHTIDNVLHGQPRQPFEWNYFPLLHTYIHT